MTNVMIFRGRLGGEPESRVLPSGTTIVEMSLAQNKKYKDKTIWLKVKVFGKTAENCVKYLSKGSECIVVGEYDVDDYTDKDGNRKVFPYLFAHRVDFIWASKDDAKSGYVPEKETDSVDDSGGDEFKVNSDIPF